MEFPFLNRAVRIQCLTEREVEQVKAIGMTAECVVIPNGIESISYPAGGVASVNIREKKDARRALGIAEDAIVILFLGRIHPKKGLDVLVRAFSQIQVSGFPPVAEPLMADIPHFFLLIAGSDDGSGYRAQIEDQIRRCRDIRQGQMA